MSAPHNTDLVFYASVGMLTLNLLPAYPLDGGRIAKCVLSKFLKRGYPLDIAHRRRAERHQAYFFTLKPHFSCAKDMTALVQECGQYAYNKYRHTSTFTSVFTGLTDVYAQKGTSLRANLPFAYSDGEGEVKVSMYDNGTLLNCYTLAGEVPVWKS